MSQKLNFVASLQLGVYFWLSSIKLLDRLMKTPLKLLLFYDNVELYQPSHVFAVPLSDLTALGVFVYFFSLYFITHLSFRAVIGANLFACMADLAQLY